MAIDKHDLGHVSTATWHAVPGNILTYSLSIFIIAIIDRILHFLNGSSYSNHTIEFLLLLIIIGGCGYVVFLSIYYLKFNQLCDAIHCALIVAGIAWFGWLYVKFRSPNDNQFAAIGGRMV
jgi:hypothetical protein